IGDLEEHHRAAVGRGDPAHGLEEPARVGDVLQGHAAADEVDRSLFGGFGEILPPELDVRGSRRASLGYEARIVADAAVAPRLAQKREERALATADLDDLLAAYVVAPDQVLGEPA